ncbi:hypothetical protein E2C01_088795 [Portunus trituberculatus]|uniref:Uncharacterized protein n=1 Tax=Portunus trituberculatus TaxID=210409 RepID=A0A5B7JKU8_PORTR|nr:hypothetical protein [Portunus trituberculatus]
MDFHTTLVISATSPYLQITFFFQSHNLALSRAALKATGQHRAGRSGAEQGKTRRGFCDSADGEILCLGHHDRPVR